MTDIADLRITTDTKPLQNLIDKLKELAAQGRATQQVLATIKVPNIPRGGGVYINPRGGTGPTPIPGIAPRNFGGGSSPGRGSSPAGRRAGITGGGFGQAFTTGNNSFADRLREAAKAAQLLQGPLGGVAARLVTLANVVENFNAVSALMSIATLAVAGTLLVFAGNAVMLADKMVMLHGRVRTIVGDMGSAEGSFKSLAKIAQETGNQMETVVDVYNRVSLGAKNLGKSNAEILNVASLATKTGVLSGTSQGAQQNALLQFGQAIGAGTVRAEEFNSLLENMPKLADEIAKGMGTTASQLRRMVLQGKVLSKDVFEALQRRTLQINAEFEKMPRTISRAIGEFKTEFALIIDEFNRSQGISETIAGILRGITVSMRAISGHMTEIVNLAAGLTAAGGVLLLAQGFKLASTALMPLLPALRMFILEMYTVIKLVGVLEGSVIALRTGMAALLPLLSAVGWVALAAAVGYAAYSFSDFTTKVREVELAERDRAAASRNTAARLLDEHALNKEMAKAYDSQFATLSKTTKGKETLVSTEASLAAKYNITTESLKDMIKEYGNATEAVYRLIAVEQLREEKDMLRKEKSAAEGQASMGNFAKISSLLPIHLSDKTFNASLKTWEEGAVAQGKLNSKYFEAKEKYLNSKRAIEDKVKLLKEVESALKTSAVVTDTPSGKKDPYKEYLNDLQSEIDYLTRILPLRRKGESVFMEGKNALAATNEVRKRNFKSAPPGSAAEQLLIDKKTSILDMQDIDAALGRGNASLLEAQNNAFITKAIKQGAEVEASAKRAIAITKELLSLTGGRLSLKDEKVDTKSGSMTLEQVAQSKVDSELAQARAKYNQELKLELFYQDEISKATAINDTNAVARLKEKQQYEKDYNALLLMRFSAEEAAFIAQQNLDSRRAASVSQYEQELVKLRDELTAQNTALQEGYRWDQKRQEFILPSLEEQQRRLAAINLLGGKNNEITEQQRAGAMRLLETQQQLSVAAEQQKSILEFQQRAVAEFGDSLNRSLVDSLNGGQASFHDFAMSVVKDLEYMIFKAFIFNKIFGGTSPFTGQQQQGILGGILGAGKAAVSVFNPAAGSILNAATLAGQFPKFAKGGEFANGSTVGIFGDDGPEAVLPLRRGSDGKLGVVMHGGGGNSGGVAITNNISVNANGGTKEQNADLAEKIGKEIDGRMKEMVTQQIAEQMRSGNMLNKKRTI